MRVSDQGVGDLGARLSRAAERVFGEGQAALPIVPAFDGGDVLLGLARFDASVFEGIASSTDSVATETTERVAALGWTLHVDAPSRDIDEPDDLEYLRRRDEE